MIVRPGVTTLTVRLEEPEAAVWSVPAAIVATTVWVPAVRLAVAIIVVQVSGELGPVQVAGRADPPSRVKLMVPFGATGPEKTM